MPERNSILDLTTIWLTFLRFMERRDPPEMVVADVFIDLVLVTIGISQVLQTTARGRAAERYENVAVTGYLLPMLDALVCDCQALVEQRGWYGLC